MFPSALYVTLGFDPQCSPQPYMLLLWVNSEFCFPSTLNVPLSPICYSWLWPSMFPSALYVTLGLDPQCSPQPYMLLLALTLNVPLSPICYSWLWPSMFPSTLYVTLGLHPQCSPQPYMLLLASTLSVPLSPKCYYWLWPSMFPSAYMLLLALTFNEGSGETTHCFPWS